MAAPKHRALRRAALGAALALGSCAQACADEVAEFYRGRTIQLVVASPAGGTYGLYGRLVVEHLPRHIPGSPVMVTQFQPASGGLTGANFVAIAAPKDGTVLCMPFKDVVNAQLLRSEAARYDARKFVWLGSIAPYAAVIVVSAASGVTSIADARSREVVMGALGGKATGSYILPTLLNALAGTRFRIIAGYPGAAGMTLAMERGETHGWAGGAWIGFRGPRDQDLKDGKIRVILQTGEKRHADLPAVPLMRDLVSDATARRIVDFNDSGETVGFALFGPEGVAALRAVTLQRGFQAMVQDPAFIADVKKLNLDVQPMRGPDLAAFVVRALDVPAEIVAGTRKILE